MNLPRVTRELQAIRIALGLSGMDSQAAVAPVVAPTLQLVYPGIGGLAELRRNSSVSGGAGVAAFNGLASSTVPAGSMWFIRAMSLSHTDAAAMVCTIGLNQRGSAGAASLASGSIATSVPLVVTRPVLVYPGDSIGVNVITAGFVGNATLILSAFELPDSALWPTL